MQTLQKAKKEKKQVFFENYTQTIRSSPDNYCLAEFQNGIWFAFRRESATIKLHNKIDQICKTLKNNSGEVLANDISKIWNKDKL